MTKKRKIPDFQKFPSYRDMKEHGGDTGVYGMLKWLYINGGYVQEYKVILNIKDSSNNPIQHSKVILHNNISGYDYVEYTNYLGIVIFNNVIPQTYKILLDSAVSNPEFITVDENMVVDILYTSIPIIPTYNVILNLKNSSNVTIPNKQIKMTMGQTEFTGETDNNGKVLFTGLIVGTYIISVEDGYLAPNIIDIIDSDVDRDIIYTPMPSTVYKAILNILNPSDNPVANKEVDIIFNGGTRYKNITNDQGQVIFNGLMSASYNIFISGGNVSPAIFSIANQDVIIDVTYTII